jgi:Flp pilus assembly protein TadD
VSSALFLENRSSLPRRTLSFSDSRAGPGSVSGMCAFLFLLCLLCFLCLLHGPAARAQSSPDSARQGPSFTKPASVAQTNAGPAVAENAVKPGESRTPDPALAPARLFLQRGMLSEAEAAIRNYLQAHADSADAHFLLGFTLFREVQAKSLEAGDKNSEALRYNSEDLSGSLVAYRDAKVKESLAEFTAGAKYHVPNAFDLKIVALDYLLLKDFMDADHWLTRSVQWDPRDAQAWYYLGRTKYSESRFAEAINAFQQCLKLDPKNVKGEDNLGLSLAGLGRNEEAVATYNQAIAWQAQLPMKDPGPYIDLGKLLIDEKRPQDAVTLLLQAIEIAPRDSQAHELLAKAYTRVQEFPKAQAELEKAVELSPQTPNLHCVLASVYRKQGLEEKAKAEYGRCASLSASQPTAEGSRP